MGNEASKVINPVGNAVTRTFTPIGQTTASGSVDAASWVADRGRDVASGTVPGANWVAETGRGAGHLITGSILPALTVVTPIFAKEPSKPTPMPELPGETEHNLRSEAQRTLGMNCKDNFNFGFCGVAGVGKSSLINALRGTQDDELGAAPVGYIETTQDITQYVVPDRPHVALWDIPGAGTTGHPAETYFMDKKLYAFDVLLLVTANRFTEIDMALTKSAVEVGTPISFVRTNSDEDLKNKLEQGDVTVEEIKGAYHREISGDIRGQLPPGLQKEPVFVVSAKVFRHEGYKEYKLDEDRLWEWVVRVAEWRK